MGKTLHAQKHMSVLMKWLISVSVELFAQNPLTKA